MPKIMLTKINTESYKKLSKSKRFQQGVRDFKEGKVKPLIMTYQWIIQYIDKLSWNRHYSYNGNYCFLGKQDNKIKVGYLVAGNDIPQRCEFCSDEDLRQIDSYRRSKRLYPFPFEDIN